MSKDKIETILEFISKAGFYILLLVVTYAIFRFLMDAING